MRGVFRVNQLWSIVPSSSIFLSFSSYWKAHLTLLTLVFTTFGCLAWFDLHVCHSYAWSMNSFIIVQKQIQTTYKRTSQIEVISPEKEKKPKKKKRVNITVFRKGFFLILATKNITTLKHIWIKRVYHDITRRSSHDHMNRSKLRFIYWIIYNLYIHKLLATTENSTRSLDHQIN